MSYVIQQFSTNNRCENEEVSVYMKTTWLWICLCITHVMMMHACLMRHVLYPHVPNTPTSMQTTSNAMLGGCAAYDDSCASDGVVCGEYDKSEITRTCVMDNVFIHALCVRPTSTYAR